MSLTDVWRELLRAAQAGVRCALITVTRTENSAPLAAGSAMLVRHDGVAVGSVSGGCIDSDAHAEALHVIESGVPVRRTYGASGNEELGVGLTCGGTIQLFVQPVDGNLCDVVREVSQRAAAHQPVSQATVLSGPHAGRCLAVVGNDAGSVSRVVGEVENSALRDVLVRDAQSMLGENSSGIRNYRAPGQRAGEGVDVFMAATGIRNRLIIVGAVDYAAALTPIAKLLGFHVTVCDARSIFATRQRFPEADEVVVDWPHRWLANQEVDRGTSICVLTHDPRFDVPVLQVALSSPAGYVGAMGSRSTHRERLRSLRLAGLTTEQLQRLHSPIGLDLGASTPEETAVSILSEIIRDRYGATGRSLATLDGPIHGRSVPTA